MTRPHMSYGKEDQPMSSISEYLEASATSKENMVGLESLIPQVEKGIFVGYSRKSRAYKCFNIRLNKILERINVNIDETNVRKDREGRKYSEEKEEVEQLKVEEVEDEEEKPEA
jgi:hypothetical protein